MGNTTTRHRHRVSLLFAIGVAGLACQDSAEPSPPGGAGGSGGRPRDAGASGGTGGSGGSPISSGGTGGASGDAASETATVADARGGEVLPADVGVDSAGDQAGADVPPAALGCGFANVVSRALFDAIFPAAARHPVYTYDGLIAAAMAYPTFAATGDLDGCRKEAAAFLAHVNHETGSLRFTEEIAKAPLCMPAEGCPCDPATTDQSKWYYGRGAIQLSWNFNYCKAGLALGANIAQQPSLVATSSELAWKTAIWFWMAGRTSVPTPHAAMTAPGGAGFPGTINAINGALECNKGGYDVQPAVTARVKAYLDYAARLGVRNLGPPQDHDC
jgi:hypothetical protein